MTHDEDAPQGIWAEVEGNLQAEMERDSRYYRLAAMVKRLSNLIREDFQYLPDGHQVVASSVLQEANILLNEVEDAI